MSASAILSTVGKGLGLFQAAQSAKEIIDGKTTMSNHMIKSPITTLTGAGGGTAAIIWIILEFANSTELVSTGDYFKFALSMVGAVTVTVVPLLYRKQ